MARALSLDPRERVIAANETGASCRQAAERFGVAKASAIRWRARFRAEGEIAAKAMGGDRHSHRIEAHAALNGYVESFNARFRDELLNGEVFYSLREAEIIIESWRRHYNAIRPHASLGYLPPAPEVVVPTYAAWPAALTRPASPAKPPVAQRPTAH